MLPIVGMFIKQYSVPRAKTVRSPFNQRSLMKNLVRRYLHLPLIKQKLTAAVFQILSQKPYAT